MLAPSQKRRLNLRARVVCHECHTRKVRCDLQNHPGSKCSNCQYYNHDCRQRLGRRKRTGLVEEAGTPCSLSISAMPSAMEVNNRQYISPQASPLSANEPQRREHPISPTQNHQKEDTSPAYIGGNSLLSCPNDEIITGPRDQGRFSSLEAQMILQATRADQLPNVLELETSVDFYFEHIFPGLPIIDRSDLENPSLLMQQTVHFAGCLVRKSDVPGGLIETYAKIRALMFLNTEPSKLVQLKALCFISCWSPNSPDVLTLDSAWHGSATAMRLAMQMGLHRESAFQHSPPTDQRRKIWWTALNTEVIQGISYGRPIMYNQREFDTKLPVLSNFERPDREAQTFIATCRLTIILADIHSLSLSRRRANIGEVVAVCSSLSNWVKTLPDDLHLYDHDSSKKPYYVPNIQLHLLFLSAFVMCTLLPGRHRQSRTLSVTSFVASCCMVQLYESILCHEDVDRLFPHHSWIAIVAAVPQVFFAPKFNMAEKGLSSARAMQILTTMVSGLANKHASGRMVLRKLAGFRRSENNLPHSVRSPNVEHDIDSGETHPPDILSTADEERFKFVSDLLPFPDSYFLDMNLVNGRPAEDADTAFVDSLGPNLGFEDLDQTLDWTMFGVSGNMDFLDPSVTHDMFSDVDTL